MAHQPLDHRALDAAVAAGVIDAATRGRLVAFADDWRAGRGTGADEEQFRLLAGFNDIFVAIAIAIFLFAIGGLSVLLAPSGPGRPVFGGLAVAAIAWPLAEYFTRRRRMALPSIELLLVFVGAVYATALGLVFWLLRGLVDAGFDKVPGFGAPPGLGRLLELLVLLSPSAIALSAAWLHWRRFRVPITVAAGCVALILPAMLLANAAIAPWAALPTAFVSGIAVFLLAMHYDAGDLERVTRRTDIAFWLHMLAAPLIVHPMLSQLVAPANPTTSLLAGLATIAIYLALAYIALVVDRRALLVSGLVYVTTALGRLMGSADDPGVGVIITALIVGGSLLLLAALWQRARREVLSVLSADLKALVPPAA